jgi:hypothetical protein
LSRYIWMYFSIYLIRCSGCLLLGIRCMGRTRIFLLGIRLCRFWYIGYFNLRSSRRGSNRSWVFI